MGVLRAHCNHSNEAQRIRELIAKVHSSVPRAPKVRRVVQTHQFLDSEQKAHLVAEYQAGASMRQLASQFGIRRQTVSSLIKEAGVTPRRHGLTDAIVETARLKRETGTSIAAIAKELAVPSSTLRAALADRLREHRCEQACDPAGEMASN